MSPIRRAPVCPSGLLTRQAAGDLGRAVLLHEESLAQHERIFGDVHPDTPHGRNTVAFAHRAAGDVERATRLYETTLAQREHILGESHPDTLHSHMNVVTAGRAVQNIP